MPLYDYMHDVSYSYSLRIVRIGLFMMALWNYDCITVGCSLLQSDNLNSAHDRARTADELLLYRLYTCITLHCMKF